MFNTRHVKTNLNTFEVNRVTFVTRWRSVMKDLKQSGVRSTVLENVPVLVLTLPGKKVDFEKLFSVMGIYWTHGKSRWEVSILEYIMKIKTEIDIPCDKFQ